MGKELFVKIQKIQQNITNQDKQYFNYNVLVIKIKLLLNYLKMVKKSLNVEQHLQWIHHMAVRKALWVDIALQKYYST